MNPNLSVHNTEWLHDLQQPSAAQPWRTLTVALSGGLDSAVLLHALVAAAPDFALHALHVHHGLSPNADTWADWCTDYCRRLGVPLTVKKVRVHAQGKGLEAAAREARYAVFSQLPTDALALAHHADDQVETLLLGALRGGGLRALAAMPPLRKLGNIDLWRPLLHRTRTELEEYAFRHGLQHIQDESNNDTALLRNWLRHQALPALAQRLPESRRQLLSSVAALQDDLQLFDEWCAADRAAVCRGGYFDCRIWQTFSPARRRWLLADFAKRHNLGTPARRSIADFERVLAASPAASAQWHLPHGEVYAYGGRLFAWRNQAEQKFDWCRTDYLPPFSGSLITVSDTDVQWRRADWGLNEAALRQNIRIRAVRSGDTLRLKIGRKSVAKILQEYKIPPFIRPYWPVVADEQDRCIAVANIQAGLDGEKGGLLPFCPELAQFVLKTV